MSAEVRRIVSGAHDRYTLLDPLAFDTPLSEVWGAVGVRRGPVVLKRAQPLPEGRMQLARESEVALACTTPALVAAIERIEGQGGPWLVLERVLGPTLLGLAQAEPVPTEVIAWILGRLALELARLHDDGLVHRDLKLENVLWDTVDGRLRLIDLGLSCRAGETPTNPAITERSTAPEAKRGAPADPRQDLFALGVLGDLLLGGRSGVPPWLTALIARLRDERPENRPHSAREIAGAVAAEGVPEPQIPVWATPNPFPMSSVRCPRCHTSPLSRFARQCLSCGSELVVVFFLARRPHTALLRLDVLSPLVEALRERLRAAAPVLAVRAGLEVAVGELSGQVIEQACFSEWRPPSPTGE